MLLIGDLHIKNEDKNFEIMEKILNKYAHENELVCFLGDLFDIKNIKINILLKIITIFKNLAKKNIGFIIMGGNHDVSFADETKTSIDLFSTLDNCLVLKKFSAIDLKNKIIINENHEISELPKFFKENIKEDNIGAVILPYLPSRYLKLHYGNKNSIKENIIRNEIEKFLDVLTSDHKLILGHFQLSGSKINEKDQNISFNNQEYKFIKLSIPNEDNFDYLIFAHIHLPQLIWNNEKFMHIGAATYVKFDEANQHRRILRFTNDGKLIEISLDKKDNDEVYVTPMIQQIIKVPLGSDVNNYVISHIKENKEAYVKIIIQLYRSDLSTLNRDVIFNSLKSKFKKISFINVNIIDKENDLENEDINENLDYLNLLKEYMKKIKIENKEEIEKESINILNEVIKNYDI